MAGRPGTTSFEVESLDADGVMKVLDAVKAGRLEALHVLAVTAGCAGASFWPSPGVPLTLRRVVAAGVSPKVAAERLGHATAGITLDRYSHLTDALRLDAAQAIDAMIGGGA